MVCFIIGALPKGENLLVHYLCSSWAIFTAKIHLTHLFSRTALGYGGYFHVPSDRMTHDLGAL